MEIAEGYAMSPARNLARALDLRCGHRGASPERRGANPQAHHLPDTRIAQEV
jgi:hypothetical protein